MMQTQEFSQTEGMIHQLQASQTFPAGCIGLLHRVAPQNDSLSV